MRLISQDGRVDFPYEQVGVQGKNAAQEGQYVKVYTHEEYNIQLTLTK